MNLKETDYYVGLDCGTNSIGFAVTDTDYNLLQARHKDMWGAHLFDTAATAEDRRLFRNARKRLARRNERIKLLQSIFAEAIGKIDPTFFLRLNESALWQEDRSNDNKQPFSLFNDKGYTDKDYYEDYPTIYHLRKALIDGTAKQDPRLVYLALHHIIKNRGHFLFPGADFKSIQNINPVADAFKDSFYSVFECDLTIEDYQTIEKYLKIKKSAERFEKLCEFIKSTNDGKKKKILKILVGYKIAPKDVFDNDEYSDLPSIEFSKQSFEEQDLPTLEESLSEDEYKLIESLKALYDWSLLSNILAGEPYISNAKVALYDKNKKDLKLLKEVIREHTPNEYKNFFHGEKDSFAAYIGYNHTCKKGQEKRIPKKIDTEAFYKAIKKLLEPYQGIDKRVDCILEDIENDSFLVLLRSYRNGILPYQINKLELEMILKNAETYMPWLSEKDSDGYTPKEKIISILEFRIPYYVGPLVSSKNNKKAWLVRKEEGKILPWNLKKKVDIDKSAEEFIKRMTNKCTYLPAEDVVPKQSLLYQKYMVLNEINNIKFNGEDISVAQKQEIYHLFEQGSVTPSKIKKLAVARCWVNKKEQLDITGIDDTIKASLSSFRAFKPYLESNKLQSYEVEEIIRWLTLFSDGGEIAKNRIKASYASKLSSSEINTILNMKFSGWGRLSRKFLCGIEAVNPETGELSNIIELLWNTNYNLMELINDKRTGIPEQLYAKQPINVLSYNVVDEERISPKVKRQIWQALRIVKEIEQIMGHKPKKVFIEMARYEGEKGKRTKSRKDQLLDKLKKEDDPEIKEIVNIIKDKDSSLSSKKDKLYLYFTQLGKCMYSGERIELKDLLSGSEAYDIDHIYPYSKSNDDSLDNKVLVKSNLNRGKEDKYPIDPSTQARMVTFWQQLKKLDLISSEKLYRLTRNTALSDEDLNHFINRQLVETRQSTLTLARILEQYYGDETKIIYSKAQNVSEFRGEFKITKSRIINELHHAHDAYLNIVVGNALHTKYSSKNFLHEENESFNHKYDKNIKGAWKKEETIKTVLGTMAKKTMLFTRQPEMKTGEFFNATIVPKGKGSLPLKPSLLSYENHETSKSALYSNCINKYGGYSGIQISHFALIKRKSKKKDVYTFVAIPRLYVNDLIHEGELLEYCTKELGYEDVRVIRSRILINTMLSVDGFLMSLSGITGTQMYLNSCTPLFLKDEDTRYVHILEKYIAAKAKNFNVDLNDGQGKITKPKNEALYNVLLQKAGRPVYKNRPANAISVIRNGVEKFASLSTEDQVTVLVNILAYFRMGNGAANLKLIGGDSSNGIIKISSTISPRDKKVFIIDQSITGLYDSWFELK